jgi:hypothetical protein
MKKLFLATALSITGASSFLLISPSKAACLTTSMTSNCATFNPATSSTAEYFAFNDGDFIMGEKITALRINAGPDLSGVYPITITDIFYSWDAGVTYTQAGLSQTSFTLTSQGQTGTDLLPTDQFKPGGGTIGLNQFRIKYTLPAGTYTPLGTGIGDNYIQAFVASNNTANSLPQTQTRISTPVQGSSGTAVPGPLPLLGVSAAFGFSRSLRKRIRQGV